MISANIPCMRMSFRKSLRKIYSGFYTSNQPFQILLTMYKHLQFSTHINRTAIISITIVNCFKTIPISVAYYPIRKIIHFKILG